MTVERCVNEALLYERAWSRITSLVLSVSEEKKASDKEKDETGEDRDESFELVLSGLNSLKEELQEESNRLWKKAESNGTVRLGAA